MVLDKNPTNYFAEVEQVAFGTGVLVDGLEFSDDKLLQGRTFFTQILSVTAWEQITSSYLNQPKQALLRICVMVRWHHVDGVEQARTLVNYEPSSLGGLKRRSPAKITLYVQVQSCAKK